jgi:diacylglycerol kinase family enzyme
MITVLLNPRAGAGSAGSVRHRLEGLFREARTDTRIVLLPPDADPGSAATEAARSSAAVVAAGGDGTVSAVAAALAGGTTPLGVLPLGTLNHFAKDLQLPLDLKQAVAVIAAGHTTAVDVGRLNDRIFLNNASLGLYPSIVTLRDDLQQRGQRKWRAFMSATVTVLWTYRGVTATLESDGGTWAGRTPFVFVGNNAYTVDGLQLGTRQTLTAGRIVAYVTPRVRTRALPWLLARAVAGRGLTSGSFQIVDGRELEIRLRGAPRLRVALDGEITTMTSPLRFRTDPGALTVLCPAG